MTNRHIFVRTLAKSFFVISKYHQRRDCTPFRYISLELLKIENAFLHPKANVPHNLKNVNTRFLNNIHIHLPFNHNTKRVLSGKQGAYAL